MYIFMFNLSRLMYVIGLEELGFRFESVALKLREKKYSR